jgi:hypothetical protein
LTFAFRTAGVAVLSLVAVSAIAGCGSGGGSTTERPVGVPYDVANRVTVGVPRSALIEQLGQPVLTAYPVAPDSSGCAYFAMQGKPLADVWEFCFDKHGKVNLGATQYSDTVDRTFPEGASAARQVLIARGDSICSSENADLASATKKVDQALRALKARSTAKSRSAAAAAIGGFNGALRNALTRLKAFNAPPDETSTLTSYVHGLGEQVHVLAQAQAALAASDDQRYSALGRRFDQLGTSAAAAAKRYGFHVCRASTFG